VTNRLIAGILLALSLCGSLPAAAQLAVPALSGRVVDETATLSAGQKAALERTLQEFEARKGSQIAILVVTTTAPEAIEAYALRVAEQWKLGRRKIDDGAVLVVAKSDRALRIEVGYGLEGALNDATAKRIISEIITPRFQQEDFNGGLVAGIDQIIRVIDGEALPKPAGKPGTGLADYQQYSPIIFVLAIVIGGVLRAVLGRFPGALATGGVVAVVAWLFAGAISIALVAGVIALFVTLLGGGMAGIAMGGRHGGFRSGGGGFGGGGGGFGGGGASGRW
jgi:uncharacterized protein